MAKNREIRIFGPPGTGKSTYLEREIRSAVRNIDPKNILVSSFTKAAAQELASRDLPIPKENVGTLHAICFRALGSPELAEPHTKQFNEEYPDYAINQTKANSDESGADQVFSNRGDELFYQYQICRAKMTPRAGWLDSVKGFARKWEGFKNENQYLDFTDLIERASQDMIFTPNNTTVGIFDEVQDFTPLQIELVRRWGRQYEYFLLAGDDDQCQPAGTMVETSTGKVPIEELDPEIHSLVVHDTRGAQFYGRSNRKGSRRYSFSKGQRQYTGNMYTIHCCNGGCSRATDNHLWNYKWSQDAIKSNPHCVYLMKKGDNFRIGWCKLFRPDGCFHLGVRARLEKADAAWILKVCKDNKEASVWESIYATKYGLPLVMFLERQRTDGNLVYSQESLDFIFKELQPDNRTRAWTILNDHKLDMNYPIWSPGIAKSQRGGKRIGQIESCNLIESLMELPVYDDCKEVQWSRISSIYTTKDVDTTVYSLDVEKYHTYVADGIATHNCLYSFTGATPEAFLYPAIEDRNKRFLTQSYRVPRVVQVMAERVIRRIHNREEKTYKPRDEEGKIFRTNASYKRPGEIVKLAKGYTDQGKSVMILASCAYMLAPVVMQLREKCIPFSNLFKRSRGDWNPLTPENGVATIDRIRAFTEPHGPDYGGYKLWTPQQLLLWMELIKAKGIFTHGAKKDLKEKLSDMKADQAYFDMLPQVFTEEGLNMAINLNKNWILDHATAAKSKSLAYPMSIYEKYGKDSNKRASLLTIGTIHSVKGGQADVAILMPDLSLRAAKHYITKHGIEYDSILRQFYVGITRTSSTLILASPGNPKFFFNSF